MTCRALLRSRVWEICLGMGDCVSCILLKEMPVEMVVSGTPGRPPLEVWISIFRFMTLRNLDVLTGFSRSVASQSST